MRESDAARDRLRYGNHGLDPARGDRLIEIGCIEIINRIPTGREFHYYLNPERDVHPGCRRRPRLTQEFLKDKPLFIEVADLFLNFIGDAPLVAHNGKPSISASSTRNLRGCRSPCCAPSHRRHAADRAAQASCRSEQPRRALQTLRHRQYKAHQARRTHGRRASRAGVRGLLGERQATLGLAEKGSAQARATTAAGGKRSRGQSPFQPRVTLEQIEAHRAFVGTLGAEAVWLKYYPTGRTPSRTRTETAGITPIRPSAQ